MKGISAEDMPKHYPNIHLKIISHVIFATMTANINVRVNAILSLQSLMKN